MTSHRVLFTATARFANGGQIRLVDFMLDWPTDHVDEKQLGIAIVRRLDLLMVHDIEFDSIEIVVGAHKSPHRGIPKSGDQSQCLMASMAGEVLLRPILPAALVQLDGHVESVVTELTLRGVWEGQPVLVVAGLGGKTFGKGVLRALANEGLKWVLIDEVNDNVEYSSDDTAPTCIVCPGLVGRCDSLLTHVIVVGDTQFAVLNGE